MANIGVFNRNISSPTEINRSLQRLEHRHTFTTKYGQIVPNFSMILMPHESVKINVTNFLRTIPMKVPMMSRVRIVQRFVAVPHRIMFLGFEDYINAVNDARFVYEEPYIANFNGIFKWYTTYTEPEGYSVPVADGFDRSISSIVSTIQSRTPQAIDFSIVGIIEAKGHVIQGRNGYGYSRAVFSELDTSKGWVVETLHTGTKETSLTGYQFFPHELGDYLNAPLWSVGLARDKTTHFSAYKFCAYQLAYSYFYRNENVQDRVDDFYEMAEKYSDQYLPEMPSFYGYLKDGKVVPPISEVLDKLERDPDFATYTVNKPATWEIHNGSAYTPINLTLQSDKVSVEATSWDRVEHFPLKSGPNLVMQGFSLDPATGAPILKDSRISLTRMRFANWYTDRFLSANPWPQRGDEARIPVVGTATFDSLQVTLTPQGSVTSSFSSVGSNVDIPSQELQTTLAVMDPGVGTVTFSPIHTKSFSAQGTVTDERVSIAPEITMPNGYTLDGPGNSIVTSPTSIHVPVDGAVTSTFTGSPSSVSLSSPTAVSGLYVSPSSFRFYMQLQKIKEMSARTDGRYKSFLSVFYGATERDSRLDRPEFIGGSVQDLNVTEVQQNTPGTSIETGVLGSLAGRGTSAKRSTTISFRTDEHCVILGLMHILPDNEYIGGLSREDNIQDAWDYPYPQFASISEQPIRMSELSMQSSKFATADNEKNNEAFGYEPPYNWRRAKHSFVTGAFRDTFNNTGSYLYYKPWIVTRNFGYEPSVIVNSSNGFVGMSLNVPTLSDAFLSTRHNVDYSNFEVTNPELMYPFMCDSYFDVRYVTVLPKRGIPKL